jgi:hypothetical protein
VCLQAVKTSQFETNEAARLILKWGKKIPPAVQGAFGQTAINHLGVGIPQHSIGRLFSRNGAFFSSVTGLSAAKYRNGFGNTPGEQPFSSASSSSSSSSSFSSSSSSSSSLTIATSSIYSSAATLAAAKERVRAAAAAAAQRDPFYSSVFEANPGLLEELVRYLPREDLGHAVAVAMYGLPSNLSDGVKRLSNGEYCVRLKLPGGVRANIASFIEYAEAMACAELFRVLLSCAGRGNVRVAEKTSAMINAGRQALKMSEQGSVLKIVWRIQKSYRGVADAFLPAYEDAFHSMGALLCFRGDYNVVEESVSQIEATRESASEQKRRLNGNDLAQISDFANEAHAAYELFRNGIVRFLRLRSMARRAFKDQGEDEIFNDTLPNA